GIVLLVLRASLHARHSQDVVSPRTFAATRSLQPWENGFREPIAALVHPTALLATQTIPRSALNCCPIGRNEAPSRRLHSVRDQSSRRLEPLHDDVKKRQQRIFIRIPVLQVP